MWITAQPMWKSVNILLFLTQYGHKVKISTQWEKQKGKKKKKTRDLKDRTVNNWALWENKLIQKSTTQQHSGNISSVS